MKVTYSGKVYYKDGTQTIMVTGCTSEQEARRLAEHNSNTLMTRYYKRNGVDYGAGGKLFSATEEHGGIDKITVIKKTIEEIE